MYSSATHVLVYSEENEFSCTWVVFERLNTWGFFCFCFIKWGFGGGISLWDPIPSISMNRIGFKHNINL